MTLSAQYHGKPILQRNKWLLLRRLSQVGLMSLFFVGPLTGFWLVKGNLNTSLTLDILPLSDPFIVVQSVLAGHLPEITAVIGAMIVAGVYALIGGRVYCSWVCPVNIFTDLAFWLRRMLALKQGWRPKRESRYFVLAIALSISFLTGTIAWEYLNPISMIHRGLLFGIGAGWMLIVAIFLFDLFISRHGWCGRFCPVGAFYGLLGSKSLVRVRAVDRKACDDCRDCYIICPEPHVITPALKDKSTMSAPAILSRDCTNCGRCIDVCHVDVFRFGALANANGKVKQFSEGVRQ
jgi:ferredoxin-type protein NapH